MARPPTSYGSQVKLKPLDADQPPPSADPVATEEPVSRRRPMETKSDPTLIYLHPDGKYELKRYALARGPKVKVHDLLMEAIEEYADRHGITGPFRVPSERKRKP